MEIINCKDIRKKMLEEAKKEVESIALSGQETPTLVIIQVGNDAASSVYIRNKIKTCNDVGIKPICIQLSENVAYSDVMKSVKLYLGQNSIYTAGILQLPLPSHLKEYEQDFLNLIDISKDADGLSDQCVSDLYLGKNCTVPATAMGCIKILESLDIELEGKNVILVGRSKLCNKPLLHLLERKNCTVTLCHSKTKNLKEHTKHADIVVTAIGKANYFDDDYFKNDAIVLDVGINRDENGKLCGDVNLSSLEKTNIKVTSTPGGTGSLTTAQLMLNVIDLYKQQNNLL